MGILAVQVDGVPSVLAKKESLENVGQPFLLEFCRSSGRDEVSAFIDGNAMTLNSNPVPVVCPINTEAKPAFMAHSFDGWAQFLDCSIEHN